MQFGKGLVPELMETYAVLIAVGLLIALLCLKMPIAFALGISGLAGMVLLKDFGLGMATLQTVPFTMASNYVLSVLPMFTLMGQLAFVAGLSDKAFAVGNKWLSRTPGGLAVATIFAGAVFGACCGTSLAAASALGKTAIPEMKKYGYSPRLATGTVAGAGLLSILIPPSMGLALYGILTGESIGKMLVSGILPGILTAIAFCLLVILMALRNPHLAPKGPAVSWKEKFASLPGVLWIIVLFSVVMGGIYLGIFTATEAAGAGAFATLLIAIGMVFFRRSSWTSIKQGIVESADSTVMIFAILIGSAIFSYFLALSGLPTRLSQALTGLAVPPLLVLLGICLLYIPLGMFLDPTSMQVLTLPIVYPIVIGLGYSGIWFGIILTKLIEIGLLTPPVGLTVFVVKSVAPDVPLTECFRGIVPFIMVELVLVAVLILFPQIVLWLPGMMK